MLKTNTPLPYLIDLKELARRWNKPYEKEEDKIIFVEALFQHYELDGLELYAKTHLFGSFFSEKEEKKLRSNGGYKEIDSKDEERMYIAEAQIFPFREDEGILYFTTIANPKVLTALTATANPKDRYSGKKRNGKYYCYITPLSNCPLGIVNGFPSEKISPVEKPLEATFHTIRVQRDNLLKFEARTQESQNTTKNQSHKVDCNQENISIDELFPCLPKAKDEFCRLMLESFKIYPAKHNKIPTRSEAWRYFTRNLPPSFGAKVDSDFQAVELDGKKRDKEAFYKRYGRYRRQTQTSADK